MWKAAGFVNQVEPWEFRNEESNSGFFMYHSAHLELVGQSGFGTPYVEGRVNRCGLFYRETV